MDLATETPAKQRVYQEYKRKEEEPGTSRIAASVDECKEVIIDQLLRYLQEQGLSVKDACAFLKNVHPNELRKLLDGNSKDFGLMRLLYTAEKLDFSTRLYSHRPVTSYKHPDHKVRLLFFELATAERSLRKSLADIGARSNPLTRCAADLAALMCRQVIEAIAYNPWHWHKEASAFREAFRSVESMLDSISVRSPSTSVAARHLRTAMTTLERLGSEPSEQSCSIHAEMDTLEDRIRVS